MRPPLHRDCVDMTFANFVRHSDIVDMRDITDDVSSMFHASYTQAGDDDHISGKSTPRSQIQSPVVGFPIEI